MTLHRISKSLTFLLLVMAMVACSGENNRPSKTKQEASDPTPPEPVNVIEDIERLLDRPLFYLEGALPTADGTLILFGGSHQKVDNATTLPQFFDAIVVKRPNESPDVLYQETADQTIGIVQAVAVSAPNELIVATTPKTAPWRLQIWSFNLRSKSKTLVAELDPPAAPKFEAVSGEYLEKFLWGFDGHSVVSMKISDQKLHLVSRNQAGVLYYTSAQANQDGDFKFSGVFEFLAANVGYIRMSYISGRYDAFEQIHSKYHPSITATPDGGATVAYLANARLITTHNRLFNENIGYPKAESSYYGATSFFVSHIGPSGLRQTSTAVEVGEGAQLHSIVNFGHSVYISGHNRETESNRFQGLLIRMDYLNGSFALNWKREIPGSAENSVIRSAFANNDRLFFGGSIGFGHNPGGLSIGGPSRVFFGSVDLKTGENLKIYSTASEQRFGEALNIFSWQPGPNQNYRICIAGRRNSPYTHTADSDWREFYFDGFLSCLKPEFAPSQEPKGSN